jgi:hypothetical protein
MRFFARSNFHVRFSTKDPATGKRPNDRDLIMSSLLSIVVPGIQTRQ